MLEVALWGLRNGISEITMGLVVEVNGGHWPMPQLPTHRNFLGGPKCWHVLTVLTIPT